MTKDRIASLGLMLLGLLFFIAGCDLPRPADLIGDINPTVPPAAVAVGSPESPVPGFIPPPVQTGTATLRFEPASQQLAPGSTTTVQVRIENVTTLAAADLKIRFNPAVLQVEDTDPGLEGIQILPSGEFLSPDFIAENDVNNATGLISYIVTQLGRAPVSGSGPILTITFRAVNAGVSDLGFSEFKLATSEPVLISAVAEAGQITVGAAAPPPVETFTPTPTLTPVVEAGVTVTPPAEGAPPTVVVPPAEGGDAAVPTDTATPTPTLTPTPTATPLIVIGVHIPKDATIGQCYWVGPKDTIHTIAKKFKTTPYALNVVNDLYPENYVFVNQVLFIPNRLGNGPNARFLRPGDTLNKIAEECKTTVEQLVFANDITANTAAIEDVDLQGFADRNSIIIPIPPFPNPSRFRYPLESVQSPIVEPECCGE